MKSLQDFAIAEYDEILSRGLSRGMGEPDGQVCIEAAICIALGLPHGDDPGCVAKSVRDYKIRLNDSDWSSPHARAAGLRDLGLAQLGSLGIINDSIFALIMAKRTIQILVPKLLHQFFPDCLATAKTCEEFGTGESARNAKHAVKQINGNKACAYNGNKACAYDAISTACYAAEFESAYDCAEAADQATNAINYARSDKDDTYLLLSASLALETLRKLGSPGCALLKS